MPTVYTCNYCQRDFHSQFNLKRHKDTAKYCIDQRKNKFTCNSCAKSYTTKFNLERHSKNCKISSSQLKSKVSPNLTDDIIYSMIDRSIKAEDIIAKGYRLASKLSKKLKMYLYVKDYSRKIIEFRREKTTIVDIKGEKIVFLLFFINFKFIDYILNNYIEKCNKSIVNSYSTVDTQLSEEKKCLAISRKNTIKDLLENTVNEKVKIYTDEFISQLIKNLDKTPETNKIIDSNIKYSLKSTKSFYLENFQKYLESNKTIFTSVEDFIIFLSKYLEKYIYIIPQKNVFVWTYQDKLEEDIYGQNFLNFVGETIWINLYDEKIYETEYKEVGIILCEIYNKSVNYKNLSKYFKKYLKGIEELKN